MVLSCRQYPNHNTIAPFIATMKDEILPLSLDVLLVCEEMNLLGGTFFALEGCKLPSNASMGWSWKVDDLKRKKEKIESKKRHKIYPQRMAIVEPVFGNIRTNKRLDRFTLRGKIKVNIQWLLYSMVHNIEKIANYGFA